jgi:hypothetical protein
VKADFEDIDADGTKGVVDTFDDDRLPCCSNLPISLATV